MTPRFAQHLVRRSWMSMCVPMDNVDNEWGERWVCGVEVSGRRALSRAVAVCCQVGAKLRRWAMTKYDVSGRPNSCWAGLSPDLPGVLRHSNNPRWNSSLSSSPFRVVVCTRYFIAFTAALAWPLDWGKWGVDLIWSTCHRRQNSANRCDANCGPPLVDRAEGTPTSANQRWTLWMTSTDVVGRPILAMHGQPVRQSLYTRYSQPWHENISALVLLNGRVGKRSCRRGSLACDGWYVRHGWQSLMRSSNSRDMPGQWTTCRAWDFVRTMPWWGECRSRRTCGRNDVGTRVWLPFKTIPWSTDKWCRPPQYGWSGGGVSLRDAGNPSST